ncbi:MAG: universal stress protein [Pseudomonadota bacterium]
MIENVLLPVSDERDMQWAVDYVTRLSRQGPIRVHLLSVQTPFNGHVRMFFKDDDIAQFHREDGEKELAPVREVLEGAGVPCVSHVAVGYSAATIAEFARRYHCTRIVMGPQRDPMTVSGLLLGGLSRQVEQLLRTAGQACQVV